MMTSNNGTHSIYEGQSLGITNLTINLPEDARRFSEHLRDHRGVKLIERECDRFHGFDDLGDPRVWLVVLSPELLIDSKNDRKQVTSEVASLDQRVLFEAFDGQRNEVWQRDVLSDHDAEVFFRELDQRPAA
jgi:hypothetical protein